MNDRPIITYKKWWHRFSPYHRKMIRLMDALLSRQWEEGLREEFLENHKKYMSEFIKEGRVKIGNRTFYWK